jgi:hypothetical protein
LLVIFANTADAVLSMNQEATVYAAMPFRRTEKFPVISNFNHPIKISHMESFRFTADRKIFDNNQQNLIPFVLFILFHSQSFYNPKFKSEITTNKQTNKQAYS